MNESLLNQSRPSAQASINVKNVDTVSIAKLTPVVFAMDGTDDGFTVIRPSAGTALQAQGCIAGVLLQDLPLGGVAACLVRGIIDNVPYLVHTRAGTSGTSSWVTESAIAIGQPFGIDTVNNVLVTMAGSTNHVAHLPYIVAAEVIASNAGSATSTANSLTYSTAGMKFFLRLM
jgi:hypothetical protein